MYLQLTKYYLADLIKNNEMGEYVAHKGAREVREGFWYLNLKKIYHSKDLGASERKI